MERDDLVVPGESHRPAGTAARQLRHDESALRRDPDVTGGVAVIGVTPLNATPNAGRLAITLRGRDQRERAGCRKLKGVAFSAAPFPSYKDIGSGAVARSRQGRAAVARSSERSEDP